MSVFCVLDSRYLMFWLLGGGAIALRSTPRLGQLAAMGGVIGILGVIFYQFGTDSDSLQKIALVPTSISELIICIGVVITIPYLCLPQTNERLRLFRKFSHTLSVMSFSLYLFHYPVNRALDIIFTKAVNLDAWAWEKFFLRITVCTIVVFICYCAFERNTDKLRKYLRKRLRPKN